MGKSINPMSGKGKGRAFCGHALAHRLDEFPVGYSLASCSPAALASASPTGLIVSNGPVGGKNFFRRAWGVS